MALEIYNKKRDFKKTKEPRGKLVKSSSKLNYSIQKHDASRLHYDLRLEWNGVLLSWAVPKGPSMNPKDKRLAVRVEDHPVDYRTFEGTIPAKEYGGGTVMLFDTGTWEPLMEVDSALAKGELKFNIHGQRLKGRFVLVQLKNSENEKNWLLIKERDEFAQDDTGIDQFITGVSSGLSMDQIAGKDGPVHRSNRDAGSKTKSRTQKHNENPLTDFAKTMQASLPFHETQVNLAQLRENAPAGDDWLHEIKFDGYRILAFLEDSHVKLISRNGLDWTAKFDKITQLLRDWQAPANLVLDGEIVVLDEHNRSDFQALQGVLKKNIKAELTYMVFDLLAIGSQDTRPWPLTRRKEALKHLLETAPKSIVYSPEVIGNGPDLLEKACQQGLEGIVSKQAYSPYSSGRGGDWVKIKCGYRQEFVITGYTISDKAIGGMSSLLLGVYRDGELIYAGRTGTGFTEKTKNELMAKFKPLKNEQAFVDLRGNKRPGEKIVWLIPKLVAEVQFAEWTDDNLLRQASFKGLREDKMVKNVVREDPGKANDEAKKPATPNVISKSSGRKAKKGSETTASGVRITSPEKMIYPDDGITKGEVASYYEMIAPRMLPYIKDRPVSLFRSPDGIAGESFFNKHYSPQMPEIDAIEIVENDGDEVTYMAIRSAADLLGAVQMNTLEFHVWGSRVKTLEKPDWIVFDLDPDAGLALDAVRQGVRDLYSLLQELKLEAFLKTSGGKGYHVVVPLQPRAGWEQVRGFAKNLADYMEQKWPKLYTSNMRKAERKGRIYVDWVRNGRGATSVAPYSLRARAGAPVSCPIGWDELDKVEPAQIKLRNIDEYMTSDPWAGMLKTKQNLK